MLPDSALTPRPPTRLFEWISAYIMMGYLFWPLLSGRPLLSSGHEYLREAGISLQHLSIALGLCGAARMYVLWHHGKFFGLCPWVRAACAFAGVLIWTEMLVTLAYFSSAHGITSPGLPNYSGLLIGELITLHRAVKDGFGARAPRS